MSEIAKVALEKWADLLFWTHKNSFDLRSAVRPLDVCVVNSTWAEMHLCIVRSS
jgi:hypothetical protein